MNSGDINYSQRAGALTFAIAAALALAQQAAAQTPQAPAKDDDKIIDRVIVTAQKREENLIDVPIAVSAFDSVALDRKQIDQATDLQLNVPNVAFSKGNFTGSNFQIRGIGVSSVGASSDSGVETHFNSMPVRNPRLFETEYFDVERVEVLRGPQGTLYGRNATGGAVNVLARKPKQGEFSGNLELEAGNYGEMKAKGALNIPVGNTLSMRFAAIDYQRDGFTQNLFTGNDVDGRDQWSGRGAIRFTPSENTDMTLTVNYYSEDSTRARNLKQMCHRDPAGALGCLPDKLAFETVNERGTLGGTLAETLPLALGYPALISPGTDMNQTALNPADLRKVAAEFDPTYEADETIATFELSHDFAHFTLNSVTGYQDTQFVGRTDYNWNVATAPYNGPGLAAVGGSVPLSQIDPSLLGSLGGSILSRSALPIGYDQSDQRAHQWSQELRLASDFDGPVNFQVGAFYMHSNDDENYYVVVTELDYAAMIFASTGQDAAPPFYINQTPSASLKSTALFGELYWNMTESFKWTAGLRWTRDQKGIKDRQMLLSVPITAPFNEFRVDETTFKEFTGRFGFDWKPGWFDDSTLYAFYSRGYKAGGFNPPLDVSLPEFAGVAKVYDPEFIDALEIGSKNVFAGGRVQANLTGFYYKYDSLQVSKIVARTSVNENIDADIWGVEGEFVFSPVDDLVIDANFSYLNTKIKDAQSINTRDPSNGDPNWTNIKDISNGANCVLATSQVATARSVGLLLPAALGGPFGFCGPLQQNGFSVNDGVPVDLSGNHLGGSPEWSFKVGSQYTFRFGGGMRLTPRLDYYWRDDFYARIFNKPIDKIESWGVFNGQVELAGANDSWYLRGYINNIMDDDNLTGMYVTDASSGLFTNVFALDPRTYGVAFGLRF
jgi:outer membrane receptor protein involved in Fe transport